MNKIAIVKVGTEITGVYVSSNLAGVLTIETIDFKSPLSPWAEKTIEEIEQSKLVKI